MTLPADRSRHRALAARPWLGGKPDRGMDQGMTALSYLISGVLLWGGLGWLGSHFLGLGFLLPIGIVIGAGFGCYMIIVRFGELSGRPTSSSAPAAPEHQDTTS